MACTTAMDSPPAMDFKSKLSPVHLTVCSTPRSGSTTKPKPAKLSVVDFDLNEPCRYFKSSFARSLSYTHNQSASLDFTINNEDFSDTSRSSASSISPPSRKPIGVDVSNHSLSLPIVRKASRPPMPLPAAEIVTNNNYVWNSKQELNTSDSTQSSSSEMNESNRRPFAVPEASTNVEAVVLQNQVDTLQWQLKQVETSCDMYRAVMEEVARFLERFQTNANSAKIEQISRSKSMHYVNGYDTSMSSESSSLKAPRTRSSTNLIDIEMKKVPSIVSEEDECNTTTYNTFKDFTWRRSPKSAASAKSISLEKDSEKLLHDAFRLSRTINNLMNTQQPDLMQHRSGSAEPPQADKPLKIKPSQQDVTDTFSRIFMRKMNMRDSRQSVRSSTGSSVHSTSSSSKPETDDEANYSPPLMSKPISEDESGFSSISSFQEIGLPLNSTMLSTAPPLLPSPPSEFEDFGDATNNATLKAHSQNNTLGLPVVGDNGRWDSLPATLKRSKYQRFSTLSHDDSSTVLWV